MGRKRRISFTYFDHGTTTVSCVYAPVNYLLASSWLTFDRNILYTYFLCRCWVALYYSLFSLLDNFCGSNSREQLEDTESQKIITYLVEVRTQYMHYACSIHIQVMLSQDGTEGVWSLTLIYFTIHGQCPDRVMAVMMSLPLK